MKNEEETKKAEEFLKDYKVLVDKHQMDLANYPVFIPDGQGGFKIIVQCTPIDISKQPRPSPFMGKSDA